ncbi:pyruvate dehydrogenase E2 component (dihydrolipoamide acetyltransferase) [Streptomyces sp. PvR006]|uniref:dihydrolipoamide acetyltransferase family protein n=1 Tax=Streptomyces sp. PvR006 TaxID=2817860 RepID=UPI001AEAF323|nr:dihydrolipoamide acetyltransferase family protein [Streptomyces sp. PvR006]MBP2585327.1 pyruvate dehydrogenase E2 component (dihydrolipoamide acetyltransferase) [Streptomyces sp. PvR006]
MTDAADRTIREFLVPDLGEGLLDATVVAWLVAPGDTVTVNQPLCVLETAKAEVEIPSPYAGTVVERRGEPGQTLLVGTPLILVDSGAPAATGGAPGIAANPEAAADPAASPAAAADANPAPDPAASAVPDTAVDARSADRSADRSAVRTGDRAGDADSGPVLVGYGTGAGTGAGSDTGRRAVRRRPAPRRSPSAAPTGTGRPRAKPPVRHLARTLGVDLAALGAGSGPEGTITRKDVHAAAASLTTGAAGDGGSDSGTRSIPVRGIRARTAAHMERARREIPDAHCSLTVDFSRLLALRDRLRARDAESAATPFALLLRLLTLTLREHPRLNATYVQDGPEVRTYDAVHLGIGTATPRGLVVPVVRDAQDLSTVRLAREAARLADGARAGALTPRELTGSTFTVSNFGALGLDEGVPVVNHPEAAILGVGSIRPRPHVVDGDRLVVRPTAKLTCAFDHRVCDGAEAAAFLTALGALVEDPDTLLLSL